MDKHIVNETIDYLLSKQGNRHIQTINLAIQQSNWAAATCFIEALPYDIVTQPFYAAIAVGLYSHLDELKEKYKDDSQSLEPVRALAEHYKSLAKDYFP